MRSSMCQILVCFNGILSPLVDTMSIMIPSHFILKIWDLALLPTILQIGLTPWSEKASVRIDGPYCNPADFIRYDVLVLVCGGIGVTPVHAIIQYIYDLFKNRQNQVVQVQKVYMFWTVRTAENLNLFHETLSEIINRPFDGAFEIVLSVTQPLKATNTLEMADVKSDETLPFLTGRLNMDKQFAKINDAAKANGTRKSILCFSCGPKQLISEMSDLCFKYDFDYHEELFEL